MAKRTERSPAPAPKRRPARALPTGPASARQGSRPPDPERATLTPAQWIGEQDASIRPVLRMLRTLVRKNAPGAREGVRLGWNLIAYQEPTLFCVIYPYRGGVKLAFPCDARIDDPGGILHASPGGMAFVLIGAAERLSPDLIATLGAFVRQARPARAD